MKTNGAFTHVQDEHLDTMIALAFDLDDAEAVQKLVEEADPAVSAIDTANSVALLSAAFTKAKKQHQQTRAERTRTMLRRTLPTVFHAAACLLLILTFSFSVAMASSAVFRSKVMMLLLDTNREDGWVDIHFVEDKDQAFEVPQEWTGEYFLSSIPDGYSIHAIGSTPASITYRNHWGQTFQFSEYDETDAATVSAEGATVRFINIGGRVAHLIETETPDGSAYAATLTWSNDRCWFSLTAENVDLDTLLRIAGSIKKIIH